MELQASALVPSLIASNAKPGHVGDLRSVRA
jgi:hypothetical protein